MCSSRPRRCLTALQDAPHDLAEPPGTAFLKQTHFTYLLEGLAFTEPRLRLGSTPLIKAASYWFLGCMSHSILPPGSCILCSIYTFCPELCFAPRLASTSWASLMCITWVPILLRAAPTPGTPCPPVCPHSTPRTGQAPPCPHQATPVSSYFWFPDSGQEVLP